MNIPTKWRTVMCVRWCGNVCAIMCIHIFDYVRIRARWIGPYAWRNVRNPFRGCFVCISLVSVALSQPVSNVVAMRSEYIHRMFATCSLSARYIFAIQKYGFCVAKVWFLAYKKGVFAVQKCGFCFLNVMLLQIGRNVFRGWVWILHEIDVDISQRIRCILANHSEQNGKS